MKKTVGLISLIIFCFCFLTGCGENEILKKEGEVYNGVTRENIRLHIQIYM